MRKRKTTAQPALGGSALLVIFAVLCLTVFALLSLQTALAQQRLSQASARSVSSWYAADLQAQEILAQLRNGQHPPEVTVLEGDYYYTVPISGHQTLEVAVRENNGCWEILSWQATAHPEDGDTALPVWQEKTSREETTK